jgi:beta-lactam-binding protein with PASTA domain
VLYAQIHIGEHAPTPSLGLVSVPDLLGRNRAEAGRLVREAGLVGPVAMAEVGGDPAGHVVGRQFPAARDRVERGTTVRVHWNAPGPGLPVAVPEVRGMILTNARAALAAAGLGVEARYAPREGAALGTVYEQSPAAGHRVGRAHVVRVTVNAVGVEGRGPRVTVPNLFRMTPEEARAALAAVGLVLRRDPVVYTQADVARYTFARPPLPGRVWGWSPAGTAATGDVVVVKVLATTSMPGGVPSDATTVTLPDLRWRNRDQVERTLSALGLRGNLRDSDSFFIPSSGLSSHDHLHPPPATPVGAAWHQKPSPGARLPIGATVEVVFKEAHRGGSVWAPPDVVVVPDVRRLSATDAIARLRTQRLEGEIDPATRPAGSAGTRTSRLEVVSQDPTAGARRPAGTRVVLGVRARRATVPSLIGLSKEAAIERLRGAWLQPDLTGPAVPAGYKTRVTVQVPAAGSEVAELSVVRVTYVLDGIRVRTRR